MGRNRQEYERDAKAFPADAYQVAGFDGIACRVLGWHAEPDDDTEWTGDLARTGRVVVVMVGDDYHHVVELEDIQPMDERDYCHVCGQVGCTHDGINRDDDAYEVEAVS